MSNSSQMQAVVTTPTLTSNEAVFLNASRNRCVAGLVEPILEGRPATALLGEPGVGKTLLLDQAVRRLREHGLTVVRAAAPLPKLLGFQRMIGDAAGVTAADAMDAATLVRTLQASGSRAIVLVVDDVQTLPVNALAFLWAMVALLERGGMRLQLMLVGRPEFGLTLFDPDLAPLSKALGTTGWVPPLVREELGDYLRHRLASQARRWTPAELDDLLDRTGGVPREIDDCAHQLASHRRTGARSGALRWRWGLMPLLASLCALAAVGFVMTRPGPTFGPSARLPSREASSPATPAPAPATLAPPDAPAIPTQPAPEQPSGPAATGAADPPPEPTGADEPGRRLGSVVPSAGRGLILTAESGDTVLSLYRRVYRGVTPPPYAEVVAANPAPLRRGSLLIFPPPPNGWATVR